MKKEDRFTLTASNYIYIAAVLAVGCYLFYYYVGHGVTPVSLAALGVFIIFGVAAMRLVRSHSDLQPIDKDRPVTEKELAEFEEDPKMGFYLRIMAGVMGMAVGAMVVVLLCGITSPAGSRHNTAGNALIPDFQSYLACTGIAMLIGFVLFYLIAEYVIFKKQPE